MSCTRLPRRNRARTAPAFLRRYLRLYPTPPNRTSRSKTMSKIQSHPAMTSPPMADQCP
jgi:hypothetical protein